MSHKHNLADNESLEDVACTKEECYYIVKKKDIETCEHGKRYDFNTGDEIDYCRECQRKSNVGR